MITPPVTPGGPLPPKTRLHELSPLDRTFLRGVLMGVLLGVVVFAAWSCAHGKAPATPAAPPTPAAVLTPVSTVEGPTPVDSPTATFSPDATTVPRMPVVGKGGLLP